MFFQVSCSGVEVGRAEGEPGALVLVGLVRRGVRQSWKWQPGCLTRASPAVVLAVDTKLSPFR